jgi:transcriptional regulator of acetoin/glycerol metabolism
MTFGQIKSLIEKNLLESYKNENEFKKRLREFKHNVLNNKSISKVYNLYDQLSTPQGLSESDAKEFIDEGVNLLQRILPSIKLPKSLEEEVENNYKHIDTLVYTKNTSIKDRINAKKNIESVLKEQKSSMKESINIPVTSMVKIANQTLRNYIETMDENSKKEFFQIVSEDNKNLEGKFEELKTSAISKLQSILENENEGDVKTKINETINKLKDEKFDQLNFLKLKNLESSL